MPLRKSPEKNLRRVDPQFRVTLPDEVRRALKIQKDDMVGFVVDADGKVWIRKARVVFEA